MSFQIPWGFLSLDFRVNTTIFLTFEYSIVLLSALICSANQIHELFADSITKFLPLFYEIR